MRLRSYQHKITASAFAILIILFSSAAAFGFTSENSLGFQGVFSDAASVSFSVGSIPRAEGNQNVSQVQANSDYQAISAIRSSAETSPYQRVTLTNSLATNDSSYTYVEQNYGYSALTSDTERTLYEYIDNATYQVSNQSVSGYYPVGQITFPAKMDQAQIQTVFMAYTNDHPEAFWLSNVFSYGYSGNSTVLQLFSVLSANDCNTAITALQSKLESVIQSIPSGLSEFDREEALYDYLTQNCSYNYDAVEDTSIWQAFSAYGALTDGSVVCEGYSRAMELLSSYLGLQCTLIRGSSGGEGHMWNAVNVDGNWYHLDLTWCDGNQPIYNYFNVTDQVIQQTHTVAPAVSTLTSAQIIAANSQVNLFLPSCTATAENYYVVKGIKITDLSSSNDTAIVQALSSALTQSDTIVAFYIDAGSNYTAVVSGLVSASPYKMKTYLQDAAQQAGKTYKQASYVVDSANNGLEICLTY